MHDQYTPLCLHPARSAQARGQCKLAQGHLGRQRMRLQSRCPAAAAPGGCGARAGAAHGAARAPRRPRRAPATRPRVPGVFLSLPAAFTVIVCSWGCWASLPCLPLAFRLAESGWCSAVTDTQGVRPVCPSKRLTRPRARARRTPPLRTARRDLQARAPCAANRQPACSTCTRTQPRARRAGCCARRARRLGTTACVRTQRCAHAAAIGVRAPLPRGALVQAGLLASGPRCQHACCGIHASRVSQLLYIHPLVR